MTKANATLKLIEALAICGFDSEKIDVREDNHEHAMPGDVVVTYRMELGAMITVLVADFHRYPGIPCYFVNSEFGKSFSCGEGTPHLKRAIMDFGWAVSFVGRIES